MNQVTGYSVPEDLPLILRKFALECKRAGVENEDHFNEVAARYFAKLAGSTIRGVSIAAKNGRLPPPPAPSRFPPPAPPVSRDPPAPLPQEVIRSPIKPQQPPRMVKGGALHV